jgi:hypothetical protein
MLGECRKARTRALFVARTARQKGLSPVRWSASSVEQSPENAHRTRHTSAKMTLEGHVPTRRFAVYNGTGCCSLTVTGGPPCLWRAAWKAQARATDLHRPWVRTSAGWRGRRPRLGFCVALREGSEAPRARERTPSLSPGSVDEPRPRRSEREVAAVCRLVHDARKPEHMIRSQSILPSRSWK